MRVLLGVVGLIWKIYVALMFILTALLLFPFITFQLRKESSKRRAFDYFVFWSQLFRRLCFYSLEVTGKIPDDEQPYIIIANHASYLDIFLIYSVFPKRPFVIMGKSELLHYPIIRQYFLRMNIPVYRGNRKKAQASVQQAVHAVRDNWNLVIFPEGGIPDYHNPRMLRFKSGAFQIAKQTGTAILPVTFVNNFKLFSDPTKLLGSAYPGKSIVVVHEALTAQYVQETDLKILRDHCRAIINRPLQKHYPELVD